MKKALILLSLSLSSLAVVSCQNGQKSTSGGSDPYVANYESDGGYNPYPGQSGYVQPSSGGAPAAPTYTQAPTVAADPYAFSSSSSSSSAPKPAPRTSTSSSSTRKPTVASSKPKSSSSSKSKGSSKSTARKGSHTVAKGDSLYAIARKNNTTVAKLKTANKLSNDLIRPGQVLKIP